MQMPHPELTRRGALKAAAAVPLGASRAWAATAPALPLYRPALKTSSIYATHPGASPALRHNHDAEVVRFKGRFYASWKAYPEQKPLRYHFNYVSSSDDFETWSRPVKAFTSEGGAVNPVNLGNQWQPAFLNYHDRTLFCAWCTVSEPHTYISHTADGVRWTNVEVPAAPPSLAGKVVGFPTVHGLLTSRDVMMFPCSLPAVNASQQGLPISVSGVSVGTTRYAGLLMSRDGGKTWQWSEPVEAARWSEVGEDPALFGGETIYPWEPVVFEQPDGRIGLVVRNSTAQDSPERAEKPHRMLLYAVSDDHGHRWSKARPIEVDSVCSRAFVTSVTRPEGGLLMVANDWHVRVPERFLNDRYCLSLFCAPVCDPDLLLPGPLVQPAGGVASYPNGFVEGGRMYLGYTYRTGASGAQTTGVADIQGCVLDPMPDFSSPFLLPRGGRSGLRIDGGIACLEQRFSSLGLVLTAGLTRQPELRLVFEVDVHRYSGAHTPVLTLGGKTRNGTVIRAGYSEAAKNEVFELRDPAGAWQTLGSFERQNWNRFEVVMRRSSCAVSLNGAPMREFPLALLRKLCFGGLYEPPEWPMGVSPAAEIRLRLPSMAVA